MNPELREAIGKVLFEQMHHDPWEKEPEPIKEVYMSHAEKVVEAFIAPFLPGITILGQELIKNNPSMRDMINQVFHQATGRDLDET